MASIVRFSTERARRMADPVHEGSDRHIFYVQAANLPSGIPKDPNPRAQNINRAVYREVERSLMGLEGDPGTFHWKNKGITIVAEQVLRGPTENEYVVRFGPGHGIVDGGHTYEIIQKACATPDGPPPGQFVKVEVLTNVPAAFVYEIAGGLNTGMQVQDMSLDNLAGRFDWIKEEIAGEPYASRIAWKEGDDGDLDARDVVSILSLFNVELYPNQGQDFPISAYSRKSATLEQYEKNTDSFKKLRPILKDVFVLHDTIRATARDHYNEGGGRAGAFKFMEESRKNDFYFPFTGDTGKWRLLTSGLYPILGAFRWMVEESDGAYAWRGGFGRVQELWELTATELMRIAKGSYDELGRSPTQMGKSRNLWQSLYGHVAMQELQQRSVA